MVTSDDKLNKSILIQSQTPPLKNSRVKNKPNIYNFHHNLVQMWTQIQEQAQTALLPPRWNYTPTRPPNSSVFSTKHWPPLSSSSLPGWHVKTVIFRHTSSAVSWLCPWCRRDSERVSGEQGARLASSPASLRLLM